MAYLIRLTTPIEYVSPDDNVQLIIEFTVNAEGIDEYYPALSKGVRVEQWGKLQWSYDLEDAMLAVADFDVALSDAQGFLDKLLYGNSAVDLATDKRASVSVLINGDLRFNGKILEDSIQYDDGAMLLSFRAASNMDAINQRMLYDIDNNPVPLTGYSDSGYYHLPKILQDIYRLAISGFNYSGALQIVHNWTFYGKKTGVADKTDFKVEDLYMDIHPLMFDSSKGISTAGDLLRRLASDFFAMTGIYKADMAIFRKLFYYDAGFVQTLGTVKNRVKGYQYGLIDYVRTSLDSASTTPIYEAGTYSKVKDRYLEKHILGYFWDDTLTPTGYPEYASDLMASVDGGVNSYSIWAGKDLDIDANWYNFGDLITKNWYNRRSNMQNCRLDKIYCSGIDYDPVKNFEYKGSKYQPMSLSIEISKNTSEFNAIYLGEL